MTTSTPQGLHAYGFEGPEDYIERITYQIWNLPERDVESICDYYGPGTRIHTGSGDIAGEQTVIANTFARLATYPDFHGTIDDTIWTGSEAEGYRTSMRWVWTGTNTGDSPFGPATGRAVRFLAIANCVVRGQVIEEEWLGANPLSQARQLGFSTQEALAATPAVTHPPTPRFGNTATPSRAGVAVTASLIRLLLEGSTVGFAPECTTWLSADAVVDRLTDVLPWAAQLREHISNLTFEVDDQYEQATADGTTKVATQAFLCGDGPDGPVELLLIAHHHLRADQIVQQWLTYDELALARYGIQLTQPQQSPTDSKPTE